MESVIKNAWGVTIVNNEIECADRIVHETGTYKAVVVSGKAGECFISLKWSVKIALIDIGIAIYERQGFVVQIFDSLILFWVVCFSKYDRNFWGLLSLV